MNSSASVAPGAARNISEQEREQLGSIALDQWRGLALVLVLLSHGFYLTGRVHGIGRIGVNLFFFISGILVFRSLSRARATSHWARTKSFWWRRLRRLYPAMIAYTLVMWGGTWLLSHRPNPLPYSDPVSYAKTIPLVFGYVINYVTADAPMSLRHLWSLACEMQFYFLAPILYWLGGGTASRRMGVFGVVLVVLMALGLAQPFIGRWHPNDWQYNFEFSVWPMMLGFFCEFQRHRFRRIPEKLVTFILWLSVAVCALILVLTPFGLDMKILVIAVGALLLAPCLLAYVFGRPIPGIGGIWMKWLGERTYSIYLWQQPFTICRFLPQTFHPAGAAASVVIGGAWFYLFERPFLSAGRRESESAPMPKRFWQHWGTALVFGLFAVAIAIGWGLRVRYENSLRRQLWPTSPISAPVLAGPSVSGAPTILLLGDSRMAEWGLPQLHGYRVINGGVRGFTTGQVELRASSLVEEFHPDCVVLEVGINDLKFIGLQPELMDPVVELARSNITEIAENCAARGSRVIVLTTWPAGRPSLVRRLVWDQNIPGAVIRLNEQLKELNSPERGIRVVDLFSAAGIKPDRSQYRDTLHFNPEVYHELESSLQRELDAMLIPAAKIKD